MATRILSAARVIAGVDVAPPLERGLPPVVAANTRVLVLGSFPGRASLAARQYYGHPRNHFWPIMAAILDEPLVELPYTARLARLRARRVGLWDTIVACERAGSLDAAIRNAVHGDVALLRRRATGIALVCFNGQTAGRAAPAWQRAGFATRVLPSTSPAYTRSFAEKLAVWRSIADALQ